MQKLLSPGASLWASDGITPKIFANWFEDAIVEGAMSPYLVGMIGSNLAHLAKLFENEKPLERKPREYKTDRSNAMKKHILRKGITVKLKGTKGRLTVLEDTGPPDQTTRLVKLQPSRGQPITGRRDWIEL